MQIQLQQLQNINFIILYNTKTDYSNLWMALLNKTTLPTVQGEQPGNKIIGNHTTCFLTSWSEEL